MWGGPRVCAGRPRPASCVKSGAYGIRKADQGVGRTIYVVFGFEKSGGASYSSRRAVMGSTRAARMAGMSMALKAAAINTVIASSSVRRSAG